MYGFYRRGETNESYKNVSGQWMKTQYDDQVSEWFLLKNGKIVVTLKDHEGVDDNGYSKKINSQSCHLRSFILFHPKRLRDDVILAEDGFKNIKIYYSDTYSIYIHKMVTTF